MTGAKAVIRYKLKARSFENQNTEAKVCVRVLNRVTELGRPNLERPA
ncbi:transposase [Sulfitobacter geojensis]|nr:transposase [Sulfitobacter geojensis]